MGVPAVVIVVGCVMTGVAVGLAGYTLWQEYQNAQLTRVPVHTHRRRRSRERLSPQATPIRSPASATGASAIANNDVPLMALRNRQSQTKNSLEEPQGENPFLYPRDHLSTSQSPTPLFDLESNDTLDRPSKSITDSRPRSEVPDSQDLLSATNTPASRLSDLDTSASILGPMDSSFVTAIEDDPFVDQEFSWSHARLSNHSDRSAGTISSFDRPTPVNRPIVDFGDDSSVASDVIRIPSVSSGQGSAAAGDQDDVISIATLRSGRTSPIPITPIVGSRVGSPLARPASSAAFSDGFLVDDDEFQSFESPHSSRPSTRMSLVESVGTSSDTEGRWTELLETSSSEDDEEPNRLI